jgi:hypothetical protein
VVCRERENVCAFVTRVTCVRDGEGSTVEAEKGEEICYLKA